ncbi:phage tail tip protein J-related protein [Pseudomonas alabamensis]|uniref:phage tail tip protein J-related protein n=1 Tax=Pseudomonas alabamensis TaxID=3064349 RepID=UPI001C931422
MSKSIKAVAKIVTAPIKAMYDPVGAFKDVFGGVKDIFAGLTGAGKVASGPSSEPSSQTVRSSKAPVRFILGRTSTGGVLAWVQEQPGGQTTGEWLHIVYVLSEGAIAGVDEIYVDEQPIASLGAFATYEVVINPTAPNEFLRKNCPDWRAEQIGRNLSFVRISFLYNSEKFPSGIPDVRFVVRGRSDIYDPRDGQSKYSANTALLILWYLRNRCGIPDDEIIFETFANAANISDELVTDPQGKRTARYFAGAVIGADEKRNAVLENLLAACAGTLIRVGGRWSLQVGAYYGPADFVITEDMVIGTVEGTTEVSNSDAINTVRGTFIDPSQAWADTDYPEVAVQDWVTQDGGELAESQSFSYVTDAYLAQRLANITLRRRRSGGTVSMPLNFNGYNCRPGRAVRVNLPSLNILGEFIVTDWGMGAMDACKVTLKPYEQAIFDDAVGQPYNPLGFINLPVGGLAAATNLAWTPATASEVVQGILSWTPPTQTVLSYTVVIRQGGVVVQALKVGGEANTCNVNGLNSGVYALSVICYGPGTVSGEATINVSVDVPPMPESCLVTASVSTITLAPRNSQGLNGGTYEYFFVTREGAPVSEAVYLGQGMSFTHTGLGFAKSYFYYVRSANAYGKSPFLFVRAATSSDPKEILEVIKDRITESELGKELTSKIEKIDGNGPGSVNERVTTASNAIKADVSKQLIQVNSTIDGVRSNLQGQVTAVEGRMTTARDDLQRQIDGVSSIAGALPYSKTKTYALDQAVLGANGKLYQAKKAVPVNVAPPDTDYWEDVGQSVRTANGTASAVSKLQMDVTTLGDTVTATSGKVDGFQASINTANSNASAAQGAAQAANDLAGGKGKVIVQNAAPAAADRQPQNLWIDTTSGANTPKRWNGSAWVSVSDKVATEAAAAAASALGEVAKKADASAVNSLKLTVEQQGRDLTSQGSTLNGMQATIDGKASSQALTQLSNRVKLTEDKNGLQDDTLKSQSESLTTLKDTVAKKADVSSVSQLSNTVNLQGQDVTAHGLALTGITARLGELGASGVNLLPAEYSSFGAVAPNFSGTSFTYATVADLTAFRGYALKFDWSTTSTLLTAFAAPGSSNFAANMGAKRQKYIISYYARASVAGHIIALYLRGFQSDGSTYNTPGAAQQALTTEWARYSYVADMSAEAFTGSQMTLAIQQNRSGVGDRSIWIDRIMVEPVVNGATEPSTYVPGNSLDQVQATASAVTSLSGQVSKNAEGLKSTSELASKLDGSLTTTIGNVEKAQKAAQDAYGLADGKGKVIVQNAAPAAADRQPQNLWIDTTSGANTPKRWNGSAWAAVTDKVATEAAAAAASALGEVAKKADASAVNSLKLTVEQQGRDITAHGLDITSLNASVGNLGASGVNLVPAEYCAFTKDLPANMYSNGGVAMSTVADAAALKGYALKAVNSNVDSHTFGLNSGFTAAGCNMGFKPGKYLVSFYARAEMAGHVVGVYARVLLADGSSFKTSGAPTFTLTTTWARYVGVIDLTDRAYTGTQMQLAVQSNRSGVANRVTYYDRFMLEAAVNNQVEPSTFSMGNSFDQSLANAAATVALDAKVTVNEGAITSASGQITELRNSIGDVGGENLIYNPSFEKPGANGLADGWAVASGSGATVSPSVVPSVLNPKESAQRINVTGISPSVWARIGNPGNRRIGLKAGTSVTLSAYVRGTPGLNVRPEIQFLNSSGSGVSGPTARFTAVSGDFVRVSLSAVVPDGAVECNFFVTCYGTSSISTAFMDVDRMQFELSPTMTGWRDNGQAVTADQAATSTAVTNLTSTVGKQGGDLTTVTG